MKSRFLVLPGVVLPAGALVVESQRERDGGFTVGGGAPFGGPGPVRGDASEQPARSGPSGGAATVEPAVRLRGPIDGSPAETPPFADL